MKPSIYQSKKGTRVVRFSDLFAALKLPYHHYNRRAKEWLQDVYCFSDDVRRPVDMQDFSVRSQDYSLHKDYYLTLEFARLITLNSKSKLKKDLARWFMVQEQLSGGYKALSIGQNLHNLLMQQNPQLSLF